MSLQYEEVPPYRTTAMSFVNGLFLTQTNVNMIAPDVPYKSITHFYFLKKIITLLVVTK